MILKKSSSPRVSRMEETVCLAMVSLRPFMLPLTSTKITTSFGEVAAWMYHFRLRQSKAITPWSSGFHLIPVKPLYIKKQNKSGVGAMHFYLKFKIRSVDSKTTKLVIFFNVFLIFLLSYMVSREKCNTEGNNFKTSGFLLYLLK